MKKVLRVLLLGLFMLICILIFSACEKDVSNITVITFHTETGKIVFPYGFAHDGTLTLNDCPVVKYDGVDLIFECWLDSDGNEFDFNSTVTEPIDLYARFEPAELVCYGKWKKDVSVYDCIGYDYEVIDLETGAKTTSFASISLDGVDTILMATDEIRSEYITLSELKAMAKGKVFATNNVLNDRFLLASDLTDNTYKIANVVCFEKYAYVLYDYVAVGKEVGSSYTTRGRVMEAYISTQSTITKYAESVSHYTKDFTNRFVKITGNLTSSMLTPTAIAGYGTTIGTTTGQKNETYCVITQLDYYGLSYSYTNGVGLQFNTHYAYYVDDNGVTHFEQYFYFNDKGEFSGFMNYTEYMNLIENKG